MKIRSLALRVLSLLGCAIARPNIVLIIADDQDISLATPDVMPHLHADVAQHGKTFTHFFAPVSLCCPSRVSLLRAQYAHNHNVTYVALPWGSWSKFNEFGYNDHWLPVFLQEAGYDTRYVGKLMNGQTVNLATALPAKGWTDSDFLLDPFTYIYTNAAFSRNGSEARYYPGDYSTDLIASKAIAQLDAALVTPEKPFFLGIAPIGPHAETVASGSFTFPRSALKYADWFDGETLPMDNASFNPDTPSGASWVKTLSKLNDSQVDYLNEWYRNRKRAVQSVDELVASVVNKLDQAGILNNTYIIYTADNGYALGTHRRQPGKSLPYEEDIRVPLIVRGPGITPGSTDDASSYNMLDLGATILDLAGAQADYEIDGRAIPFKADGSVQHRIQEQELNFEMIELPTHDGHHTVAEYWIYGVEEGKYGGKRVNTTYRALRIIETSASWAYHVWCTGEHELYDMVNDSIQMSNLFDLVSLNSTSSSTSRLVSRLDALLLVLKTCIGTQCKLPWASLFPKGQVTSLDQALDEAFDVYFDGLPKVTYAYCDLGFHAALEFPVWHDSLAFHDVLTILRADNRNGDNA